MRTSHRLVSLAASLALAGCAAPARDGRYPLPCRVFPSEVAEDGIAACARVDGAGRKEIAPTALDRLMAGGSGPVPVWIGEELHYVNAAGVAVAVLPYDNGADDFVEGLSRTVQEGKVGFIDESLAVVIPPVWDFAFPFERGEAFVCQGCTRRPAGDEHQEVVGGLWGVIDRRGRVIVAVRHSRDDLRALREK